MFWNSTDVLTLIQADFGLSTSDADRVVTKERTGQLQVGCSVSLFTRDCSI